MCTQLVVNKETAVVAAPKITPYTQAAQTCTECGRREGTGKDDTFVVLASGLCVACNDRQRRLEGV